MALLWWKSLALNQQNAIIEFILFPKMLKNIYTTRNSMCFLKVQHYFALWTLGLGSENWYGDWLPCAWQVAMGVRGQESRGNKQDRQTARHCLLTPTQTPLFISKLDVRQYKRMTLAGHNGHIGGVSMRVCSAHSPLRRRNVRCGSEAQGLQTQSKGNRLLLVTCVPTGDTCCSCYTA